MTIGVVVADDQAIVRPGFRLLIDSEPDLTVLGEAADGAEAVAVTKQTAPDVVLMDIRMPVMDGIAATRLITADGAQPRVLILTTFDLDEYVFAGLRAGASGFMLKDRPPEELLSAVRVIAADEALLAPNVTRRLIEHFVRYPDPLHTPSAALAELTVHEREVLGLVAAGLSNAEIASKLAMAAVTIFIITYIDLVNKRRQIGIERAIGIRSAPIVLSYVTKACAYALAGIGVGFLLFRYAIAPLVSQHPFHFPNGPVSLATTWGEIVLDLAILIIVAVDQPERLLPLARGNEAAPLRHDQVHEVTRDLSLLEHGNRT